MERGYYQGYETETFKDEQLASYIGTRKKSFPISTNLTHPGLIQTTNYDKDRLYFCSAFACELILFIATSIQFNNLIFIVVMLLSALILFFLVETYLCVNLLIIESNINLQKTLARNFIYSTLPK